MLNIFVLVLLTITQVLCDDDLVITLPNGKIRGVSVTPPVTGNLTYYAYLGIPFAQPPVGKLRFQAPQPAASWDGIFEANNASVSCYQVGKAEKYQTEDCLKIHVYTPLKPNDNRKLAVVASVYGGSFLYGHASYSNKNAAFLMAQDVILVTFNYRVGPFGFLSTGDTVIAGNMGLKDQQLAFKWIQQNIEFFGGDPQKVTVMGQSAGSASVTYQLLSPGSAGLFRAVIATSGSALCDWANQRNPAAVAYGIAAEINPNFNKNSSTQEVLDFLQSVEATAIAKTNDHFYVFPPVIEVPHEGAFITDFMYYTAKNGNFNKVPVFMGFNSEEYIGKGGDLAKLLKYAQIFDKNPRYLVDGDMGITDDNVKLEVGNAIKNVYVGDGSFANNLGKAVQYYSDSSFIRPIIRFADLISQHVDVYFYEFTYHGELGGNKIILPGIGQVAHGEDQHYFWAIYDNYDKYPESDVTTLKRYVKLISNFVKFLNPTPESDELFGNVKWEKVTSTNFNYMDIGENLNLLQNPRNFSYRPWVKIYDQYAVEPIVSY